MAPQFRLYSAEVAETILERLADGESLTTICKTTGMPSRGAVEHWNVTDIDGFAARYARAREAGYRLWGDDIIDISDEAIDANSAAAARVRIDTRKWVLAKMMPKVYGDKLDLNHSGDIAVKAIPDDRLESRLADILGKAGIAGAVGGKGTPEGEAED